MEKPRRTALLPGGLCKREKLDFDLRCGASSRGRQLFAQDFGRPCPASTGQNHLCKRPIFGTQPGGPCPRLALHEDSLACARPRSGVDPFLVLKSDRPPRPPILCSTPRRGGFAPACRLCRAKFGFLSFDKITRVQSYPYLIGCERQMAFKFDYKLMKQHEATSKQGGFGRTPFSH